jgi:glycosyltransferase involved in cell wall biosynthesis
VAEVANDVPFVRLDIAGTGPLDNEIARLAASLGIGRNVKLLGYVEDMPKLYASADVVVQSSTTEGLPNVILEAAFLGVPVIATDVGGTREVIQHGESGWLVKPNSMEALVDGLRHYIASPDAHWRMAAAGRSRIQGEFTFAARTEAQTRVYEELT